MTNKKFLLIFLAILIVEVGLYHFVQTSFLNYGNECMDIMKIECEKKSTDKDIQDCDNKQTEDFKECILHPENLVKFVLKILSPYFLGIFTFATLIFIYLGIKKLLIFAFNKKGTQ